MSLVSSEMSLSQLCFKYKELQQKLAEYNTSATREEKREEIMILLHEFNDVKDAAQVVIGALANMEGKTIKEIHLYYNLPLNE